MRRLLPRAGWLLAGLAALALAGSPLFFHTGMGGLAPAWIAAHPWAALAAVSGAGFLDGINPCAITTLLLFLGAVLAAVERAAALPGPGAQRGYVWWVAGAYIGGIFLLYFALGLGFLQLGWLQAFGSAHLVTRVAGLVALALGLLTVREYFFPDTPLRIAMPGALHGTARRWTRQTTAGAALVGGVLIGLCTIPCGGGMYLAVVGLLASLPGQVQGYGLLTAYNVAFVLPLVLIVALASSRPVLQALSRWHIRHRGTVKLVLGLTMIGIALLVLAAA